MDARRSTQGDGKDVVGAYLDRIGEVALLNAEQEVELAKRIEAGLWATEILRRRDEERVPLPRRWRRAELEWVAEDGRLAQHHMVEANLRLAVKWAQLYLGRGLPFEDLIQIANAGLIHAMEKFDFTKGYKFSTYAVNWLKQYLRRGLADMAREIRVPLGVVEQLNKLAAIERRELQKTGEMPPNELLAKEMDLELDEIEQLQRCRYRMVSLQTPVPGDTDDDELGEFLVDVRAPELIDWVLPTPAPVGSGYRELLRDLPPKQARAIIGRLGLEDGYQRTFPQLAQYLGCGSKHAANLYWAGVRALQGSMEQAVAMALLAQPTAA